MDVHDERDASNKPADFAVVWHIETGAGKMTANEKSYCWDTLEKGQVDLDCPAGDWPTP